MICLRNCLPFDAHKCALSWFPGRFPARRSSRNPLTCIPRKRNPGQPLGSRLDPRFAGATSKLASGIPSTYVHLIAGGRAYRFTLVAACCGRRETGGREQREGRLTYWVTVSMPFRYCSSSGVPSRPRPGHLARRVLDFEAGAEPGLAAGEDQAFSGRCTRRPAQHPRPVIGWEKRPPIISGPAAAAGGSGKTAAAG